MEGDDNIVLIDVDSNMSANLKASNSIASGSSPFSHTPSPSNTRSNNTRSLVSDTKEDCGTLVEEIDSSVRMFEEKLLFYNKDKDKDMHVVELFAGNYGSIYKVPSKLRELNEDAYTPRVVSIGPLHYGKPQLQAMERYKWMYLDRFLHRTNSIGIKDVILKGIFLEDRIRTFYQDRFDNISCQEFSAMIMLDGIFVMELLMEKWSESSTGCSTVSKQTEKIFDYPWMENDVRHDMMLLENQLPYMVLNHLCYLFYSKEVKEDIPLHKLVGLYFDNVVGISRPLPPNYEYRHRNLVDFLRKCHVITSGRQFSSIRGKLGHIRSATDLQEAGVKFAKAEDTSRLLDIVFTLGGAFIIPHLKVDEWTETFFRNLVAFEQCSHHEDQDIASYIILMSSIMRTTKDVDLLVRRGIIENVHNSNVSSLFSNLRKEIAVDSGTFFYTDLCDKLNTYSKDRWHHFKGSWLSWKRMLRRDYFSNPWSIISVIAVFILLSVTILQSVCSVIQVKT